MQHEGDKNPPSEGTPFLFFVSPLAAIHFFLLLIFKNHLQAVKKNPNDAEELKIGTLQHADNYQIGDILTFRWVFVNVCIHSADQH